MGTERIHWVDIAKGIGIIFIIYAHMLGGQDFRYLFYSFHIPLFLFLSGIVYNPEKYVNFLTYFKKTAKGLLLPYLIFALISFALWIITSKFYYSYFPKEIIKQFLSIFYANSNNNLLRFNNILWFLPMLFVTKILFALIVRLFTKTKIIISILIFFSILGYLFSIYASHIKLPLGIETALSAIVFYGFGFLWNQSQKAKIVLFKYKYFLFFSLLVIGGIISTIDFNSYGQQIDMRLNHLNSYFSFYLAAFCGTFAWISFSQILSKNSLLEIIGRNSLILFAWHFVVFAYITMVLNAILGLNVMEDVKLFIPLIYTIISIIVIFLINFLYNRLRLLILHRKVS
jgi:acyltransferase